jgi:hypothetical protein
MDISKYPFWQTMYFDLTNGATSTGGQLGYTTYTNIDTRAELISATNSQTAGKPIILDIISRAARKMGWQWSTPSVMVTSPNIWDAVVDAKTSLALGNSSAGYNNQFLKDLIDKGFGSDVKVTEVDGIPIVCDDTKYKDPATFADLQICPDNRIFLFNLDSLDANVNDANNWLDSGWKEVNSVYNTWYRTITATLQIYARKRYEQGIIVFPTITF